MKQLVEHPSFEEILAEQKAKQTKLRIKLIVGIILFFTFVVYMAVVTEPDSTPVERTYSTESTKPVEESDYMNRKKTYNIVEQVIKRKLKAPSTAEFPSIFVSADHVTKIKHNEYLVTSWVDSQNSFGAMIRTSFICTVKLDGDIGTVSNLTFY